MKEKLIHSFLNITTVINKLKPLSKVNKKKPKQTKTKLTTKQEINTNCTNQLQQLI